MEIQSINENNKAEVWLIEGGTPIALKRKGWKKDSVKVGDNVVVVGNPDRNPEKRYLLLEHLVLENGVTFNLKSLRRPEEESSENESIALANIPAVVPSRDFSGTWQRGFEGPDYFLPPKDWPLTKLGEEQVARFDERNNPAYDCLERGLPFTVYHPYGLLWSRYNDRIEVILQNSKITRTFYLNQDKYPDGVESSQMGHSIASFDDDGSLLVDTVGFPPDKRWGLAPGLGSSEQKHILERYTLSKDGLGIDISITVEDPIYLLEPVTITGRYLKVVDDPFDLYVCDLENARRNLSPPMNTP